MISVKFQSVSFMIWRRSSRIDSWTFTASIKSCEAKKRFMFLKHTFYINKFTYIQHFEYWQTNGLDLFYESLLLYEINNISSQWELFTSECKLISVLEYSTNKNTLIFRLSEIDFICHFVEYVLRRSLVARDDVTIYI